MSPKDRLQDLVSKPETPPEPPREDHRPTGGMPSGGRRTIKLTSAAEITIRPAHWLWEGRIALGTLGLLAGLEGIGKSTFAYQLAADLSRGRLPGRFLDQPRSVIVAATEDSWGHTVVPRLMAADADLTRIYRVDVQTSTGTEGDLSLPDDLAALERHCRNVDAALILLDPLGSRLTSRLDTHKDAEVRQALEPLVRVADKVNASILGLMHFNKGTSSNVLNTVMGSRAFTAVARSVLAFSRDPDDETTVLVGQIKNNLGRLDLPTLTMTITDVKVADTPDGPIHTGRLNWTGQTDRKISDIIADTNRSLEDRTATDDAADWLHDYLDLAGGTADSAEIKREAKKAGHAEATLKRARKKIGVTATTHGYPRRSRWELPVRPPLGETEPTDPNEPTDPTADQSAQSDQQDIPF